MRNNETITRKTEIIVPQIGNMSISCYISATHNDKNYEKLEKILQRHDIIPIIPSPNVGTSISEYISRELSRADFVIILLSKDKNSGHYFELGIATSLGKPFIVLNPEKNEIPLLLADNIIIESKDIDSKAFSFALKTIIAKFKKNKLKKHSKKKSQLRKNEKNEYRKEIIKKFKKSKNILDKIYENHIDILTEKEIIEFIKYTLKASGVNISAEGSGNLRPDLSVWDDKLDSTIGNPVVIEIKKRITKDSYVQVTNYFQNFKNIQSGAFLILHGGIKNPKFDLNFANVYVLSLKEFFRELEEKPFSKIITELRNKKFHGVKND